MGSAEALYSFEEADRSVKLHFQFSSDKVDSAWAERMVEETIRKWEKDLKKFTKII